MNFLEELTWRGMVYDATEGVADLLKKERITAYVGIDPTASSLHIGNLLPMMALSRLQRFGHSPIAIAGGGTGMIGDPSGKTQERSLLSLEEIERNLAGIKPQLARFLDFDAAPNPARIVNNADWLARFDLLGFLRDTGKYFTVNYMLQKESVDRRLESEEGISYTEFSYLLLQARDYRGGNQVRQDGSRDGVARSDANVAVSVLSVLAQYRRSRRRDVLEVLHVSRSCGRRCVGVGDDKRTGKARGAARPRARGDDCR